MLFYLLLDFKKLMWKFSCPISLIWISIDLFSTATWVYPCLNPHLLTLSWRGSLLNRNQSIDLLCKWMVWFLYATYFWMKELGVVKINLSNFRKYLLSKHWISVLWTQFYRSKKVFLFYKSNTRETCRILKDSLTPILNCQRQCQCWKFYSVSALYNIRLDIVCFYHSQFNLCRSVTKALKSQTSNSAQKGHACCLQLLVFIKA